MSLRTLRFGSEPQLVAADKKQPLLQKGSVGEGVAVLQQALMDLGFAMPHSTARQHLPDGNFGAETQRIIVAFQRRNGLAPDGIVGPKTLGRLEQLLVAEAQRKSLRLLAEMEQTPGSRPVVSS